MSAAKPQQAAASTDGEFKGQVRAVLHAYAPRNQDELKLIVGTTVRLLQTPTGGWWEGESVEFNDSGWFPTNHVSEACAPPPSSSPRPSPERNGTGSTSTGAKPAHVLENEVLDSLRDLDSLLDSADRRSVKSIAMPTSRRSLVAHLSRQNSQSTVTTADASSTAKTGATGSTTAAPPAKDAPKAAAAKEQWATVTHAFAPRNEDELALAVGARVCLLQLPEGGWWQGRVDGAEGWFPSNHVKNGAPDADTDAAAAAAAAAAGKKEERLAQLRSEFGGVPRVGSGARASFSVRMRTERSELNQEIAKQLQIRVGAEKLLRAMPRKGKKAKAAKKEVLVTLSFVNARIQNLRFRLQQLNESIHDNVRRSIFFQNNDIDLVEASEMVVKKAMDSSSTEDVLPLIAFGLKETTHVDLSHAFANSIRDLYHEDAAEFKEALDKVQRMRNLLEEHVRDQRSLAFHFRYYHQYRHLEKRFFREGKHPDIVFHWYDSFSGAPTYQKSSALERACVLFNAGALCSQIAASQDLKTVKGLKLAREHLQIAAGAFQFVKDNFLHAPSADLSPQSLSMLVSLSLAQAQECLFELSCRANPDKVAPPAESAYVGELYLQAHNELSSNILKEYVPPAWIHFTKVKALHFDAVADVQTGREQLAEVRHDSKNSATATWTGVARLARADMNYRKALKMCRELLPKMTALSRVVRAAHAALQGDLCKDHIAPVLDKIVAGEDLKHMLPTKGNVEFASQPVYPDLYERPDGTSPVSDLFKGLGPIRFFNAGNRLGPQHDYDLTSNETHGFGFTLGSDSPVGVHEVMAGSPADALGIKRGVVITRVNGEDVKHASHNDVIAQFRAAKALKIRMQTVISVQRSSSKASVVDIDITIDDAPPESPMVPITARATASSIKSPGFGGRRFSLTGKGGSMQNLAVEGDDPNSSNLSNRSSHSMTDEIELPNASHIFGDEQRKFQNPLYAAKHDDGDSGDDE